MKMPFTRAMRGRLAALEPDHAVRVKQGPRVDLFAPETRCLKVLIFIAVLVCANGAAAAQDAVRPAKRVKADHASAQPALPPAVPQQFAPPQEAYASFAEPASAAPPAPSACQLRLAKVAAFKPLPVLIGPGECGAADAVLLESVVLPDEGKVAVSPPATLRCTMAEQVALWLREDVAAAALKLGAALRGLDDFDSYECRGRNRVWGAKLSEHGRANALDVRGFRLANGAAVELTDVKVAKDWREELRTSACARFSTVLGPGSDGNHEEHIHLDLAERRGGYKMCEWDVRVPPAQTEKKQSKPEDAAAEIEEPVPLPRPRPIADAADEPVGSPSKKARARLR
jgi:hypothetical protein